ncbi:MAG: NFACT family protein [Clostridia bacterium]|nr:NFACT family protein [Clostridia bacterium]
MALDALAIRCLAKELADTLIGGRIDKIHQPERDEILLNIRTFKGAHKLILSASSAHPRIHFTTETKPNPTSPPMFCMLMRKHIGSGKIIDISQPSFERIVKLDVESYDELGDLSIKHIIIEIMGRHSNIILANQEMKIIDSIKHVDFSVSSVRQILPGMQYQNPPSQNKLSLIADEIKNIRIDYSLAGERLDKAVLNAISGISPLTAREIVYRALGSCSLVCGEITEAQKEKLNGEIMQFSESILQNQFKPCIISDISTGKVIDFSSVDIMQYENSAKIDYYANINDVLCSFYQERDSRERMKQKSADLVKLLNTHIERCSKKLALQKSTLKDAENKEKYKIFGDLLTANLYRIEQGSKSISVENYYEENCPTVEIPLSPILSPSQNAQKYYKNYSKAKNAEIEMAKQIENTLADIAYLESTLLSVESAQNEEDINEIRNELASQGYLNHHTQAKKSKKQSQAKPLHFVSSDGFDIYVGKNNTQNDYLTLKFANSGDLWFHTKNIHGSHTIIKLGTNKDVPKNTIIEAAILAAYYSKARFSSQVPVDYTSIKNVRKPSGAKPGMVIYDSYNTVYVTPKDLQLESINQ